jgi:hypothetical protein
MSAGPLPEPAKVHWAARRRKTSLRMLLRVRRKVIAVVVRARVIARLHCVLQVMLMHALPVQLNCAAG